MEQQQQQQQQDGPNGQNVDYITNRLGQMNVDLANVQNPIRLSSLNNDNILGQGQQHQGNPFPAQQQHQFNNFGSNVSNENVIHLNNCQQHLFIPPQDDPMNLDQQMVSVDETLNPNPNQTPMQQQQQQQQVNRRRENMSNILIVTNVDSSVFSDSLVKAKFESLFNTYDPNVTFRYLKSFRRVRLDFSSPQLADMARVNLNNYKLANCVFKCYLAQIIRPNNSSLDNNDQDDAQSTANSFLNIPKPTKQFLISPPASPPVGWEPVTESSPCIDVQLISALSNLIPGKVHEIHAGNESQPGIFVEVCEEAQFDSIHHNQSMGQMSRGCPRIPKTMSPTTFQMQQ